MLTEHQQFIFDEFEKTIQNREILLKSSEHRVWGKSYILDELGYVFQALGYEVHLLTMFPYSQEHIASDSFPDDLWRFRGKSRNKMIILVDEYKYSKILKILEFCEEYKIPMVGFVDYD